MKKVAAIIVTYNRKELVEQCIKAILAQERANCDIIVIDNGSTDGTEELFRDTFKNCPIDYTNMGENLGCAESTARGMKKAVEKGYEYIWIMDDDVIPKKDALYQLRKMDRQLKGQWGILSGAAYWKDGSVCEANRQKKTLFTFMKEEDYQKKLVPVRMVSLASMFVKASVIKEVGLIKGEYFIYSEDYDFCARVGKKYPIYVVTECKVTHMMRENRKVNFVKEPEDRLYRYKYLYRNDVNCYRQLGHEGWTYLIVKYFYTLVQLLLFEKEHRFDKISVLTDGYIEGLNFKPQIQYAEL